ncbi:retinol dehydrogenase 13-like [Neocloeon triangulifer]|uniref:retinol dehydrogenase 13-like n=1 Tax=Neocloeon triangulifer TaxID=2078957 RepID=UPI00286F2A8E|nr:retinol dehydrogenase 13-like [Neocloeon triangulifer]
MLGKVVIVTGANRGIGKETAKVLAQKGAKVILACRDLKNANEARNEIIASSGNEKVTAMKLDLGSLDSVRDFVRKFTSNETRLDVLINNAAAVGLQNKRTADGLQQEMQINHFGPFLLTILLLDILKKSAPSRVVVVSSRWHASGKIELDNVDYQRYYPGFRRAYQDAKLANALFSRELAKRLHGSGVTCNCLHPGVVNTGIRARLPGIFNFFFSLVYKGITITVEEGAATSVFLASSEEVQSVSGKYFVDGKQTEMAKNAQDPKVAAELFDECARLVKLTPRELEVLRQ